MFLLVETVDDDDDDSKHSGAAEELEAEPEAQQKVRELWEPWQNSTLETGNSAEH